MKTFVYPAIFVKDNVEDNYKVLFPDLEITTDGQFVEEAFLYAKELLKAYFVSNSSYTLSEDAIEVVNKIRNKSVKAKILALDTYRKKLAKERKLNELYNSSDNLKMGDCATLIYHSVRTSYILYGI